MYKVDSTFERLEAPANFKSSEELYAWHKKLAERYSEDNARHNKELRNIARAIAKLSNSTINTITQVAQKTVISQGGTTTADSRSGYVDVTNPGTVTVTFSAVSTTTYVPQIPYVVSLDEDGNVQITLCVPVITATNDTRTATSFSIYVPIAGRLVWRI